MRSLTLAVAAALVAGTALAVPPSTDIYIPSVAHAPGQCVDSICPLFQTDVWIYNPSTTNSVSVTIAFLPRNTVNSNPTTKTQTVATGETKEIDDIVSSLFNLNPGVGALRFTAATPIVVTGRIYDTNVVTNKGTGSAGQFFGGLPTQFAIGLGESTTVLGLAQDASGGTGTYRANFGFVETTGNSVEVMVTKVDDSGATLAGKSYTLGAREPRQYAITDVGGALGTDQRLIVTVTGGTGKVLAFGSQVDNRTGDPYTVEMVTPLGTSANTTGTFDGVVWASDNPDVVDGGIELTIDSTGLLDYQGSTGIPCGDSSYYVLDFYDTPLQAIPIAADGSFSTQVSYTYYDGTVELFTTNWTLSGTVMPNGVVSGTLRSETTGGTGDDAACNVTADRPWKAGWTGN
jgi:hypothetical protein